MSRYLLAVMRAVWSELKLGAVVMAVLLPVALLVAAPVILAALYLPDWAWWTLFGAGFLWMMFGDAVSGAIRREAQQPTPAREE